MATVDVFGVPVVVALPRHHHRNPEQTDSEVRHMKKAIVSLILLVTAGCSAALTHLPAGEPLPAPTPYVKFCQLNPCEDQSTYSVIPLTERVRASIDKAHTYLRDRFVAEKEPSGQDVWKLATEGDCEDYALTLRRELRQLYPDYAAAFGIATAYMVNGDYHAVMIVHTFDGQLVCDIMEADCKPWNKFPYAYDFIQNGQRWERLAQ